MEAMVSSLEIFLQTAAQMGTHILLATLGAILCEKAGNLNLGVEGMMLLGAVGGFAAAIKTQNPILALLAAGLFGMLGALIYAFITVTLQGNQTVTGLVLTIFGSGLSSSMGKQLTGTALPESVLKFFEVKAIPVLCNIPIIGKMLFVQSIYVPFAVLLAVLVYIYLYKTRIGRNTRMVGENPAAADACGINVTLYKYANILAGGFLCGLGGAFLTLAFVPRWQAGVTAGAGWIAVALVIFATWNPLKAIFGAYLFGALRGLGFSMQNANITIMGMRLSVPSQILSMLPYIATIVVLIFISLQNKKENNPPASLGNPYYREER